MSGTEIFGFVVAMYVWFVANPLITIVLYFLPIIIAIIRKHKSTGMVVILSLLFGWIFLLWL
ncbi:superinfection immunity protein, partial [Serratia marcescens]|uniref:superinfection immunity protein n=1 Tax=Serratia marcescens TaxID=615 RepID=UPI001652D2F4